MPCYFPLQASFSLRSDGKKDIRFSEVNHKLFSRAKPLIGENNLSLPCGQCMGCRLERSRQWAVRCFHESRCYDDNCFVTLTYSPEFLPPDGSLVRKHAQDFIKRLRSRFSDRKIRVFYCGEYGEKLLRPHYHFCIFNLDFSDKVKLFKLAGNWHYSSSLLSSLWSFGHSTVTDFSFDTAAYVARYCTKKITGSAAADHYGSRLPEFVGMSLRPGIGSSWFEKFSKTDLFPHDNVIVNGTPSKPPRYYDKLRERVDPVGFQSVRDSRSALALERVDDNTHARLAVRLKCLESRIRKLFRRLEASYGST